MRAVSLQGMCSLSPWESFSWIKSNMLITRVFLFKTSLKYLFFLNHKGLITKSLSKPITMSVLVCVELQLVLKEGTLLRYLLWSKTVGPFKAVHTSQPASHSVSSLSEENKIKSFIWFEFLPLYVSIELILLWLTQMCWKY